MRSVSIFICVLLYCTPSVCQLAFKNSFPVENNFYVTNLLSADLDNNGYKDLAYANITEMKIELLYNTGSLSTLSSQTINISGAPGNMPYFELGDVNNDSKMDIVSLVVSRTNPQNSRMVVLLSTGNTFTQQNIYLPISYFNWIPQLIDFDKDGNLDLVIGNSQSLYFYKGYGNGTFTENQLNNFPINWYQFKSVDLNLDGKNDFLFATLDTLFIYQKNAQSATNYIIKKYPNPPSSMPLSLTVSDFSGDGYPDLILNLALFGSGNTTYKLVQYINDGSGNLNAPVTIFNPSVNSGIVGNLDHSDFDNDGRIDLVAGWINHGRDFVLLKNSGNNQWSDQSPLSYFENVTSSILFADLDNDGTPEVITLSYYKYLNFYKLINGNYQFQNKLIFGSTALQGTVGDFNKDGFTDIQTCSYIGGGISVFYGNGPATFDKPLFFYQESQSINTSITADFNSDGFDDILFATIPNSNNPELGLILTNNMGVLSQRKVIDHNSNEKIIPGDFNSDGIMDFVSPQGVFINDGQTNFQLKAFATGLGEVTYLTAGLFNDDNSLDIAYSSGSSSFVGLNDGSGNFNSFDKIISSSNAYTLKSTLINDDKLSDLVSLNTNNGTISVFINQGSGNFNEIIIPPSAEFGSGYGFSGFADADDINFDGLKDIVVGVAAPQQLYGVAIYLQDKSGNFVFDQNVGLNAGINGNKSIPDYLQIADIDNDSKKDIVAFRINGDPVIILLNDFVFEPSQPTQEISITNLTSHSASFSLQKGSGNGRIGILRESQMPKALPQDGFFYSSNTQFGIGAKLGAENYVIIRKDTLLFPVSSLKEGTDYTLSIFEYNINSNNTIINYAISNFDSLNFTTKKTQTISVNLIATKILDDSPFKLNAIASSGLSVIYEIINGGISIVNDTVKIISPGPVKIKLSQPGNNFYDSAASTEINFCVNPKKPTVIISNLVNNKYLLTSSSDSNNQWFVNGQPISGATDKTWQPNQDGVYSVRVEYSVCSSLSDPTSYVITANEIGSNEGFYPNPFHTDLFFSSEHNQEIQKVTACDALGRSFLLPYEILGNTISVDVSKLSAGLYFFKVETNSKSFLYKLIKTGE